MAYGRRREQTSATEAFSLTRASSGRVVSKAARNASQSGKANAGAAAIALRPRDVVPIPSPSNIMDVRIFWRELSQEQIDFYRSQTGHDGIIKGASFALAT